MAGDTTRVYVGTIGQSVWRSEDGGASFRRASEGVFSESDIRALAVHPGRPEVLYLGTERGCYRSTNGGDRWDPMTRRWATPTSGTCSRRRRRPRSTRSDRTFASW